MTPLLPSDAEQLINPAFAAIPLRASRPPPGEQSSYPEPEKHQDGSGIPSDIPQITITSMHYVSLFDMY